MTGAVPIEPAAIAAAIDRLRAGGLVAFPTETVYGLGALAFDERAVGRVFEAKGRPATNPLIVHVADTAMAALACERWPAEAEALARRFWPGPLTLVIARSDRVPRIVTAGGSTVAVRCPDHPVTLALLRALGEPLVGPSANRSGHISPTTAAHVRQSFAPDDVLVLDGGPCERGIESTVLDITAEPARVLRPGVITEARIAETLAVEPGVDRPGPQRSPGQHAAHYAPRSTTRMFESDAWPAVLAEAPSGSVLLSHRPDRRPPAGGHLVRLPADAEAYAAHLYARLREADAHDPPLILIERPDGTTGLWAAIQDRLRRAAAGGSG